MAGKSEVDLRFGNAVFDRKAVPLRRLKLVLLKAQALVIAKSQTILRRMAGIKSFFSFPKRESLILKFC